MAKRKLQIELSLQQKSEVLLRIQKGESQRKLIEQNGVSKTTVANIKKRTLYYKCCGEQLFTK
jgi:uncharacterized protein YerC